MNNPPDDTTLALWLDDELDGDELARVEAWAADHPEQLAAREEIRRWRRMIGDCLPAAEEPPAAEFFNERIQHALRLSTHGESATSHAAAASGRRSWRKRNSIWMPLAACAGMVLAFWLGALLQPKQQVVQGQADAPAPSPHLYTPEQGVNARWISSHDASATVIVLSGVRAIPDEIDFTATASIDAWRASDSTAAIETENPSEP